MQIVLILNQTNFNNHHSQVCQLVFYVKVYHLFNLSTFIIKFSTDVDPLRPMCFLYNYKMP